MVVSEVLRTFGSDGSEFHARWRAETNRPTVQDNSIVIACVDNEFTVKYLRMDGETVSLVPANKRFKPIVFSEGMELKVFGVVTAVIHQFVKREVPKK